MVERISQYPILRARGGKLIYKSEGILGKYDRPLRWEFAADEIDLSDFALLTKPHTLQHINVSLSSHWTGYAQSHERR